MLDAQQQDCVKAPPNDSIVIRACPGSGKSTTIAHRCAELVNHGIPPNRILVLTFSKASRDDLAAKLAHIGGGGMPSVTTHHAFALSLLRRLPGPHSRSVVVEARAAKKLLRECLPDVADPVAARRSLKRALALIAKAKSCGEAVVAKTDPDAVTLLRSYDEELRRRGLIDFEDMINLTADAIRNGEVANGQHFQPSHTHLLLDEAQDTSTAQLALLQAMAPVGSLALTVVGDADQT